MAHRIEVRMTVPDSRAQVKTKELGYETAVVDVYTVDRSLLPKKLHEAAQALGNSLTQQAFIDAPSYATKGTFDWVIEIGFLPGVTDNVGTTAQAIIGHPVYFSRLFLLKGLSKEKAGNLALTLYNPLIERAMVISYQDYRLGKMKAVVPNVRLTKSEPVISVSLNVSDDELTMIGKSGIMDPKGFRCGPLALSLPYLHAIREYFKKLHRNPTDIELESIAQTWSEHCKHTIFSDPLDELKEGLFTTYIKRATDEIRKKLGRYDFCVSVFTDNSGGISFDTKWIVTHKVETHNSPSALDPFGGAVTGIGGVNRDAMGFGLGAKPIVNTYGFCFSNPNNPRILYRDKDRTQPLLSSKRIMDGVIAGVNAGGNCSGIPTPQGFVYFDDRYRGKPLVFVGTVGFLPKRVKGKRMDKKRAKPGEYIVMAGGRVGLDGIHGATFSSQALSSGSPATAVQIGDPITQKKLSDVLIKEARDKGLYTSITDNGAGGLSCSVAEMAKESGGCIVQLENVPLKYPGLTPWQIWISESQERMTLSVPKNKWKKLYALLKKRGVEATVIGTFTNSGKCIVNFYEKKVMDVSMKFLHDGLPPRPMQSVQPTRKLREPKQPSLSDYSSIILNLLRCPSISSFAFISSQFDHEVQGTSVIKPLQGKGRVNGDVSVVRPLLESNRAIALSQALYPSYSEIDPYAMAACSIDTAIRNVIAVGADPKKIAILDNFCWTKGRDPDRLWELKEAARACFDTAVSFKTPFISGKDSMFNDFSGFTETGETISIAIPPTLLISSIGICDIGHVVSMDLKSVGDLVYLIGDTNDELGGSEYFRMLSEQQGSEFFGIHTPQVNIKKNTSVYERLFSALTCDLIASAISVHHGGLAVALVKTALSGQLGLNLSLDMLSGNASTFQAKLFSESSGRILVTIRPEYKKRFEMLFHSLPFSYLGTVTEKPFVQVAYKKQTLVYISLADAQNAYFRKDLQ